MDPKSPAYRASEDDINLFIVCAEAASYLAVDTETTLGDIRDGRAYCMGISIAYNLPAVGLVSNYFPFRHKDGNLDKIWLKKIQTLLENHERLIFHNAKFDIVSLATLGIIVDTTRFYDTMLMAHMCNENEPVQGKGLDALTKYYLNDPGKKKSDEFLGAVRFFGWDDVPPSFMHEYAAYDADLTLRLYEYLQREWESQDLEKLWSDEQKLVKLLIKMEGRGVRINQALVDGEVERGQARMVEISETLKLNPSSPKDLEFLLIGELGLPIVKKTKGGRISFDKQAMAEYEALLAATDDNRASLILEYRGYQKTVGSNYKPYRELLSPDGRLRCNYLMHRAVTSRLSCEKPALQQIPRVSEQPWNGHLKSAFIPKPGYRLWEADYSQLELRLGAFYAQESDLIEVFNSGRDIFTEMSIQLGLPRQETKTLTYTLQYGGGVKRISDVFGVHPIKATAIKDNFFATYPGFRLASNRAANKVLKQGFIRLWTGRRRHFSNPRDFAYQAWSSVLQGGGAEIVKHSMIRLDEQVDNEEECRMLLQVHDSVMFEIKIGREDYYLPRIKQVMEAVPQDFGVKFLVDVHEWGE